MKPALVSALVLIVACSSGTGATRPSPNPAVSAAASPAASPAYSPAASPSAAPSGGPGFGTPVTATATCSEALPAGDRLVLGTLTGSPDVVVRDIQDLAHARTICDLGGVGLTRFVNSHTVSYEQAGKIVIADLAARTASALDANGAFAWSLDGRSLTYLAGSASGEAWHLVTAAGDRVLANLASVPGRGIDSSNDDTSVGFSADGRFVAVETTFPNGGTGETAPLQIRRTDGTLVYSRDHGTMGVWAGNAYYFRDGSQLYRWSADGLVPLTLTPTGQFGNWIRPHASPDGGKLVFYWRDPSQSPHVAVLNLARGVTTGEGPAGRVEPAFADPNNVWYQGEGICSDCMGGVGPTGKAYLFDIAGQAESASRIAQLFDTWPKST